MSDKTPVFFNTEEHTIRLLIAEYIMRRIKLARFINKVEVADSEKQVSLPYHALNYQGKKFYSVEAKTFQYLLSFKNKFYKFMKFLKTFWIN